MINEIIPLSSQEQAFIQQHSTDDVRQLLLRPPDKLLDVKRLAAQIAARQKARDKLPTWYANPALVFPPALSVEQASSERTAQYKASLVGDHTLIDLTGGMGVDTWAFAQRVEQVVYVEQRSDLAAAAAYNLPLLAVTNVNIRNGNGLDFLQTYQAEADWLYIDPARRDERGGKVVRLEDCEPDVANPQTVDLLLTKAKQVLIKTSPLLDIDGTIRLLGRVTAVHVVAVQGEVKEVLFVLSWQEKPIVSVEINAVNLLFDREVSFLYGLAEEQNAVVKFGEPDRYIYEPNAAVLKAGAFRLVGERFGLTKLAPNSHLYTGIQNVPNFPGRVFELQAVCKPDRKALQAVLPQLKANLTVRNFPQSVDDLRKKLGLQDGGDVYILATTLLNGDKRLLVTRKAQQL